MRTWIMRITAFFLIVGLSACSSLEEWHEEQHKRDGVGGSERRLYINGATVPSTGKEILDLKNNNREEFNKLVDDLIGIKESEDKIDNRDEELKRFSMLFYNDKSYRKSSIRREFEDRIENRISGIGGFSVRLFIHYFFVCSDDELRSLGTLKVVGKIENWLYDQRAAVTTDGVYGEKGSGLIFWRAEAKDCKGIMHDYEFHIAVDEAYELWENLAKGPKLKFASESINEMIPDAERLKNIEENRRFDYKLHASGKNIKILSVLLDNKIVSNGDPIYTSDDDSCIDVFFEGKIDSTTLPDQSDYCMGRCDKPPIINTGGM